MDAFVPTPSPFAVCADNAYSSTVERPRVITLCGSTRFMREFEKQNELLTLQGNVVMSVATKAHEGYSHISEEQKVLLDRIHLEKIRMSDEILVINVGGYIGPSTRREIDFAEQLGRKVRYLVESQVGACSV